MDPITLLFLLVSMLVAPLFIKVYNVKVIEPREIAREAEHQQFFALEKARAMTRRLELEAKQALTLEDKIWLFDMGRTDWEPEDEPEISEVLKGIETNYGMHSAGVIKLEKYWWDLPDWYVDFLTTRPFHSEHAAEFYKWACEGIDVKTHLAELKQFRENKINEWKAKQRRIKQAIEARVAEEERARKEERDKREAQAKAALAKRKEEASARAAELELARKKRLGLTGDYRDTIVKMMDNGSYKHGKILAPGSDSMLAVLTMQKEYGLTHSLHIDDETYDKMKEIYEDRLGNEYYTNKAYLRAVK